MPLIPLFLVLFLVFGFVLALPFSLVQRYRVGKARRPGRLWAVALNLAILVFSIPLFVWTAAVTNLWVPNALRYALIGLAVGIVVGLLGLALTKWEKSARTLYYTPNRWLILVITLAVTARLLYGFWRGWQAWSVDRSGESWLAAAGIAGSLSVGAVVLGYYLSYSAGVCWRLIRHGKRNVIA
jgi:hypothetical protein